MIHISLSKEITVPCPELHIIALTAKVTNTPSDERLWEEITTEVESVRSSISLEDVNKWEPIRATRQAYKRLGKDPNRYRPSAEALRRRILRELPLYRIDTLVDIINLVSIKSGFSIGGFDVDKIVGNLVLGVGQANEHYEAIGRGLLNIEGLPVYRDEKGGIGTPTSDEERTKIDIHTTNMLMMFNGYSGVSGLDDAARYAINLLKEYVLAHDFEVEYITFESRRNIVL